MSEQVSADSENRLSSRIVTMAVVSAVLLGTVALLGPVLNVRSLTVLLPGGTGMVPSTAVTVILAGVALWLVAPPGAAAGRRRAGQALGLVVAASGVAALATYLSGWDPGMGTLLFPDRVRDWWSGDLPGHRSPHSAAGFVMAGLSMALLDVDAAHGYRPASVLAPAGALLAIMAMLGKAYGLVYLTGTSTVTAMAYPTAASLVAISAGLLACRPERPVARVFLGRGPGGVTVRRFAPAVLVVILLVGVLLTAVGGPDTSGEQVAVSVTIASLVLTLYVVFLRAGSTLDRASRALRNERDFVRKVLDSLREGVLMIDENKVVTEVTPRWCEITGYAAEDVIGHGPPYPWWPPERVAALSTLSASSEEAMAADAVLEFDLVMRRADGTDIEVLVTAAPMRNLSGRRLTVAAYRDITERKRNEAEQRRAAEELDHFFDASTDLMCIVGPDGYFRRLNAAWERTLGHPAAELRSRPYLHFIHPDDVAETRDAAYDQNGHNGLNRAVVTFDNRYRCRDGSYRWLSWNAVVTGDAGLIYAVGRDNTDQRDTDEVRARMAAIIDWNDDAIIGKTLMGVITSWNPAAERQYGYREDEAIGHSIRMLIPPELPGELPDILERVAMGESVRKHNVVRIRKDGSRLNVGVSISPIRDTTGTVVGAASISRDITDRVNAEERFHRLVLGAPDAMVIVDESGIITLVNDQTERLFGYRKTELVGRPIELLVPPHLHGQHVRHRQKYLRAPGNRGMGVGLELVGLRRDGSHVPIEISLAPLDTDQGVLVSAAIRDISERRQVEQALSAARDEALAATQLKSQFVAMVSHEIRTPMNGVIGLTGLLLETPLEPAQHRYAEAIRDSGRALLTIINDILDFSKIEAGKVELVEVDFELDKVLEEVLRAAAETARDKDLEVVCYYPPGLPTALRGDDGRLRQALLNLLGNSVKFTDRGSVLLRAEPVAPGADGRPRISFTVQDTGIGIAPEALSQLYEPFSQVDAASNRQFGGTGLGLTITRQLVELMGGRLDAKSQPGHGSQFFFTLPFTAQPGRSAVPRRISGYRLLVIDGNATSRDLITEHTQAWGMLPTAVPDSRSALGHLRRAAQEQLPYRLAVINQHIHGDDGLHLTGQIVGDTTIATVDIVLLSSGSYEDEQNGIRAGAAAVLPAPISPSQLYNCLLEILDPEAAQAAQLHRYSTTRNTSSDAKGLVLLAEDNEINQMVAVDTLTMFGYQVDVACNGIEVLEFAGTKSYSVILMDCQMPKMDGYAATVELRRREGPTSHIPIIAMTAGALAEDRQHCLDAGMDDYLTKPIDPRKLRATLEKWMKQTH